ncbi:acyl carrier protein [Cellulomonas carbonis]|uniref:acyl carrier protein n=1 Tax=Cellulomonas carbonis TaxID=1386092 RepID=UPI001666DECD|nr:acyl carrier protein [Cellulomonas carbonis]
MEILIQEVAAFSVRFVTAGGETWRECDPTITADAVLRTTALPDSDPPSLESVLGELHRSWRPEELAHAPLLTVEVILWPQQTAIAIRGHHLAADGVALSTLRERLESSFSRAVTYRPSWSRGVSAPGEVVQAVVGASDSRHGSAALVGRASLKSGTVDEVLGEARRAGVTPAVLLVARVVQALEGKDIPQQILGVPTRLDHDDSIRHATVSLPVLNGLHDLQQLPLEAIYDAVRRRMLDHLDRLNGGQGAPRFTRGSAIDPLDVCVNYMSSATAPLKLGDWRGEAVESPNPSCLYPLMVQWKPSNRGAELLIASDHTDRVTAVTAFARDLVGSLTQAPVNATAWQLGPTPVAEQEPDAGHPRGPSRPVVGEAAPDAAAVSRIVRLFREMLPPGSAVSADTDFFRAGGNSLSALAVLYRLAQVEGIDPPRLYDLKQCPTPRLLAERIR